MAQSASPGYQYVVSTFTTGIAAGNDMMVPCVSCANTTTSLLGGTTTANGGNGVPNVTNANPSYSLAGGGRVQVGNGGGNLLPVVSNANRSLSLLS